MGKTHGTKDFWLAGLRSEASSFSAAISQSDALDLPVPSCPGWTVSNLVRHLGGVYRWTSEHVARGVVSRPERTPGDYVEGEMPVVEWWNAAFSDLLTRLETVDPELPAWNWAPRPKKAIFWHRRMVHETAVHRWDAQMSTGLAEPLEARLAADGLAEAIDTHLASSGGSSATRRPGVIALQATDVNQIWYIRLRAEGVALLDTDTVFDDDDRHERVTAIGTASDLMLAIYERIPFEVLQTSGDIELLNGLFTE